MTGYHTTVKGKKYYLHKKGTLYYFSTKVGNCTLPTQYKVMVNARTGLPFVKGK